MKALCLLVFSLLTLNSYATEIYNCDFTGPDFVLTFHDSDAIKLQNSIKTYDCQRGFETFPGTEIELNTLACSSNNGSLKFYITQYSDTEIILSRNVVFAKDISCKKK